jgi:TIR domain-containing protein
MQSNRRADVFISHSSEDSSVAQTLCGLIEERGVQCWIAPRDVPPGAHFAEEVISAIEKTQATVVLLSEHSNLSTYVRNEVERAVSKGKPVLPVRIRNVVPSRSLELYLSASQWIDAWVPPLVQRADQIVAALRALIPRYSETCDLTKARIGVIAIGGGAIRATESIPQNLPDSVRFVAAHTYLPTLESCRFPTKIQLGRVWYRDGTREATPRSAERPPRKRKSKSAVNWRIWNLCSS